MAHHGNGTLAGLSSELQHRLREVGRVVPPEEIGDVWIFPPLPELDDSREFVLFTRPRLDGRQRVYSARSMPEGESRGRVGAANGNGAANGVGPPTGTGSAKCLGAKNGNGGTLPGGGAVPIPDVQQELVEHGSVPNGRVARIVESFRRRIREDREPLHLVIGGSVEEWERWIPAVE